MSPASLSARYEELTERIARAASQAGREPDDITLLAISKRHPDTSVEALAALGHRSFGENLVQAWTSRLERFVSLEWHLVGARQSNNVSAVVKGRPALVHTLDRPKIIRALSRLWKHDAPLDVLLQVNIDREAQKAGCLPEELDTLADLVSESDALRLRGLMCIPRPVQGEAPTKAFANTRMHLERINDRIAGPPILSMGMSADFEAAIAEGSTLVRVGTALFGSRAT